MSVLLLIVFIFMGHFPVYYKSYLFSISLELLIEIISFNNLNQPPFGSGFTSSCSKHP